MSVARRMGALLALAALVGGYRDAPVRGRAKRAPLGTPLRVCDNRSSGLLEQQSHKPPRLPVQWGQLVEPRLLGVGGFATVWKYRLNGSDPAINLAVKAGTILDRTTGEPNLLYLREAQCELALLRRLPGPGFARIYGDALDIEKGRQLVVMEVADADLLDFVRSGAGGSMLRRLAVFLQILQAVSALERHDFVHRDLKPENILVRADAATGRTEVKVADLGFACHLRRDFGPCHKCRTMGGTVLFRAPETFAKDKVRCIRLDTWSLGLVLYFTMYGGLPSPLSYEQYDIGLATFDGFDIGGDPNVTKLESSSDRSARQVAGLLVSMLTKDPCRRPKVQEAEARLRSFLDEAVDHLPQETVDTLLFTNAGTPAPGVVAQLLPAAPPLVGLHWFGPIHPTFDGHICCCFVADPSTARLCKVFPERQQPKLAPRSCEDIRHPSGKWVDAGSAASGCRVNRSSVFAS